MKTDRAGELHEFTNSFVQMAPEKDEILKRFGDSLKDLKNLRKQLYSAADCFESSYKKHNHKQFVVESSREYVTKALVSTVDHLGSAAHKLNKYLDEKTTQFCATNIQVSLIQQRLSTMQGLTGDSHNMFKIEPSNYHKHHLLPGAETLGSGESKVLYGNCVSSVPFDVQQNTSEILSRETVKKAVRKKQLDPPLLREKESREAPSPNPPSFSFTRMAPEKGPGRRSISPLRFLSTSVIKRSVSPTPSLNRVRWASEARRAISTGRRRHDGTMMITKNRESEKEVEESYTKRSKHLFKALLSLHHSKKNTTLSTLPKQGNPA